MRRTSIALIFSVALATIVTAVLAAFAWPLYKAESDRRWQSLRQGLASSADQLASGVALPVWNFDDGQVFAIMTSGLNHPDLQGSVVAASANNRVHVVQRNTEGVVQRGGKEPSGPDLLVEQRPIVVEGKEVGVVRVYATTRFARAELRERLLAIFAIIIGLDAALVASVYLLLWFVILKPLKAVGQYAAAVQAGGTSGVAPAAGRFYGELGELNGAVHQMVSLLDSRFEALSMSEERLSIATRAAHIGIWDWDVVNNLLVWDDEIYRQYQIKRTTQHGNYDSWARRLFAEDLPRVQRELDAALRGEREYDVAFRITWPNGHVRHMRSAARTFRDAAGKAVRMVGVSYDMTEVVQAEQELLRHRNHLEELVAERTAALSVAVEEAEAANRAKSVFLATMSHELRTPLNSVIGFSRLMADSQTMAPDEKHNMAIIHRSGQHLLTLINDILELSKIEAGRSTLNVEPVDVGVLAREVVEMVTPRAHQGGLAITLDCSGLPPAVVVDSAKLRQVLLNLMSNAVKFVERGSVTLEVRAMPLGAGRHTLDFAVRDTGIGIAPEDQSRIFEPFIQAGGRSTEGTGLGLAISRQYVRIMGGRLELESQPGVGSVFSFSLQVQAAAVGTATQARPLPVLAPEQQGRRILVIDDSADGRHLLAGILEPLGFVVAQAADGEAGLLAVAEARPELVFMDWRMPGIDGLEATRRLRADASLPQPKVVILTASAFEEERREALAAGADDFLRKPIEQDQLRRVLEQQLGLRFEVSGAGNGNAGGASAGTSAPVVLEPVQAPPLTPAMLAGLPPSLRIELSRALQELNLARVGELLAGLDEAHGPVARGIGHMVERYEYRQLHALLAEAGSGQP